MKKKTVPLILAIFLILNTTFGVALIQNYFYKSEIAKLIAYVEYLEEELGDTPERKSARLKGIVLPDEGLNIGIRWEDLGARLVETGVIDEEEFLSLYKFSDEKERYGGILSGNSDEFIVLDESNSRFVLNTLWALGLVQSSDVLTSMQEGHDNVGRLASTGGWSLGDSDAMDLYGTDDVLELTDEQQWLVMEITQNIYRPCCNNHTAFADCNHGMAMLGLVELLVVNDYEEEEIYDIALKANSYWFPDTYITIADYFETVEDTQWQDVDSKLALGFEFSSGSGYQTVQSKVKPLSGSGGGGGCSV